MDDSFRKTNCKDEIFYADFTIKQTKLQYAYKNMLYDSL